MVAEYRKEQENKDAKFETFTKLLAYYRGLESLAEVIRRAANAENSKKTLHSHQYRIRKEAMGEALEILKNGVKSKKSFRSFKSFEELHVWFAQQCGEIHGLGPLYVYDTCLRLGAYLKLEPEMVYLQAGALMGARVLLPGTRAGAVSKDVFPKVMQVLEPCQIEDFLCVYKDRLKKLKI
jgi:hypothetical protein